MNLKNNKGFVGTDIAVAVLILLVLIPTISGIIVNINKNSRASQRKADALNIATNILETAKAIDLSELEKSTDLDDTEDLESDVKMLNKIIEAIEDGNYSFPDKINTSKLADDICITYSKGANSTGYKIEIEVKDLILDKDIGATIENLVKTVKVNVKYRVAGKDENVEISTVVSADNANMKEKKVELISETESYVGYYADIDGNGTVDGIIYADLAVGASGQWYNNLGGYSYSTTNHLKEYAISTKTYDGQTTAGIYKANDGFGEKQVIVSAGNSTGNDRFYVMALEDFTITEAESDEKSKNIFDWYNSAYEGISDYASYTSENFATGKENTENMISKWNSDGVEKHDNCWEHKDIWGLINDKYTKGWFIPSRAEWSAFAEQLEISKLQSESKCYINMGLSEKYWTSSQMDIINIYDIKFYDGRINYTDLRGGCYVRLSTTF